MKRILQKLSAIAFVVCFVLSLCTVDILAKETNEKTVVATTKSTIKGEGFFIANEKTEKDSFTARISVPKQATYGVSVGYVDVALEGDGSGKMSAKLWKVGTISNPNITVKLQKKTTGSSWSTAATKTFTSIGNVLSKSTVSCTTSVTAIWKVTLSGKLNGGDVSYSTYEFLYNKKAVRYPDYTDSGSGKKLAVPATNLAKVESRYRVTWSTSDRNKYINWYNQNYPNKITDWSKYQIHHMRPREYGGTNDYSNLIPLLTTYHQKTVSPWWVNY